MRARKLVLNMTAFLACLALVAGCGPSFKSGRDKSPQETKQTPPSAPPSQNPEVAPEAAPADEAADTAGTSTQVLGTEAGSPSPSTQPLSINGESKLLADKLVIGASLEKIGANHKITAILKDSISDLVPRLELSALIDLSTPVGTVADDKLEFAQIGKPPFIEIDEAQYSVDYRCLVADCASIEINLQRLTGDKVGYRVSMEFEKKADALVLKRSSLTAETLLSANDALQLADPMLGIDPVDAVAESTPPALIVAPALKVAPGATPAVAVDASAKERRELVARLNALPKPMHRHKMPTCDKNSQAYKNAAVLLKKKVVAGQIAQAEKAVPVITLTTQQKADALSLKPNAVIVSGEPKFPLGSRCNPRPQAKAVKPAAVRVGTRAQAPKGTLAHPLTFVGPKY